MPLFDWFTILPCLLPYMATTTTPFCLGFLALNQIQRVALAVKSLVVWITKHLQNWPCSAVIIALHYFSSQQCLWVPLRPVQPLSGSTEQSICQGISAWILQRIQISLATKWVLMIAAAYCCYTCCCNLILQLISIFKAVETCSFNSCQLSTLDICHLVRPNTHGFK